VQLRNGRSGQAREAGTACGDRSPRRSASTRAAPGARSWTRCWQPGASPRPTTIRCSRRRGLVETDFHRNFGRSRPLATTRSTSRSCWTAPSGTGDIHDARNSCARRWTDPEGRGARARHNTTQNMALATRAEVPGPEPAARAARYTRQMERGGRLRPRPGTRAGGEGDAERRSAAGLTNPELPCHAARAHEDRAAGGGGSRRRDGRRTRPDADRVKGYLPEPCALEAAGCRSTRSGTRSSPLGGQEMVDHSGQPRSVPV